MIPGIADIFGVFAYLTGLLDRFGELSKRTDRQKILLEFNQGMIELHSKMYALGAEYEKLTQIKNALEEELVRYKRWDEQAARYELKKLAPGIFVYSLKASQAGTEPLHTICPQCFEKQQRSILQRPSADSSKQVCHQCKFEAFPADAPMVMFAAKRSGLRSIDGA